VSSVHQPCRLPVVAYEPLEVPLADVDSLRAGPDPDGAPPLPKRFLRHADEQSVVAVRAVQRAIAAIPGINCSRHGVIAAPCQAGRIASSRTLSQYAAGGGVTVSTHIVPQASLHALAAAVSVGLGMHGPSLGVGGGPQALQEGLLTAAALVDTPGVDGWWLVASELVGEPRIDAEGKAVHASDATVEAVALLIDPACITGQLPQWWLRIDHAGCDASAGVVMAVAHRLVAAAAKEAA
jgi:hypothetical protein